MQNENRVLDTVVIVPAYNEETVILESIKKINSYFENIVIVDDCSTDNTVEILNKHFSNIDIISLPINTGCGMATETGIEYALNKYNTKYFATIDADGQHNIIDLVNMRKQIIKTGDDIIIGSRFLGNTQNISKIKEFILKSAVKFSNAQTKTNFTDTHNGIRIFNKFVAKTLKLTEPKYQFSSEILERIVKNNYKYSEFPVTVKYTDYSVKKGQKTINAINIASDVLMNKILEK